MVDFSEVFCTRFWALIINRLVAVGLWGAFLSDRALRILPFFPSIMAVGAAIGIIGLEVPLVEFVIALSGVVPEH